MNSVRSNNISLKYQWLTTLGIINSEFVAKTQFLWKISCRKITPIWDKKLPFLTEYTVNDYNESAMVAISLQIKLFYYLTDIVCFAVLVKSKKSVKSIKGIESLPQTLIF